MSLCDSGSMPLLPDEHVEMLKECSCLLALVIPP